MISFIKRLPAAASLSSSMEFLATTAAIHNPAMGYTTTNRYIAAGENIRQSIEKRSLLQHHSGRCTYSGLHMKLLNSVKRYRLMSTLKNESLHIATDAAVPQNKRLEFMAVFPDIIRDMEDITSKYNPKETSAWFTRVLQYNLQQGKQNRGLLTALTYKRLVKPQDLNPENMRLAYILGWCVELLHAFFLVVDDVMDNSITRRGQTCWYKLEDVGFTAINDAIMMENSVYELLKKYFRNTNCYTDLLETFHESTFITACGQNLDLLNAEKSTTTFSIEKYKAIVANKTSHYSFYLPFAVAMHYAGIKDPESFRQSKTILYEIGKFFQIQDDFIDCYGNPKMTGKIGTDIQDNKCSWLAVVCMQRANDEQKQIMLDCYGKNDPEKVQKIIDLYNTLNMPNIYAVYEEESYNMIKQHIQQMSCAVPHEVFLHILNKLYKRDA